jgi:hypothetical protein
MKVNTVNNIKSEGRKESRFLVDKVCKKIKSIQSRLIIIIKKIYVRIQVSLIKNGKINKEL